MTQSTSASAELPLRRLLRQREAEVLLKEFQVLLPGRDLALVGADGRAFASVGDWTPTELEELLPRTEGGQTLPSTGILLQPLRVDTQTLGVLAARGLRGQDPAERHVLRCLEYSLVLLLAQALQRRDLARETLDRYREINLLYTTAETIGGCLDPDAVPQLVLGEAQRVIQAEAGAVLLPRTPAYHEDGLEVKASYGDPGQVGVLHSNARHVIDQVLRSGRPAIASHLLSHPPSLGSLLCVPLRTQEQVLGVVLLGRLTGRGEFTAGDEKLLTALGGQGAIAIERARLHQEEIKRQRLEEELAIGRQIQLSLLPKACPAIPGWEFAATYQAARLVGGDLYDFIELPGEPRQLGMVIADVSGKGVPAALFMAFSRTIMRTESLKGHKRGPADTLRRVNRSMIRDIQADAGLFLSAFYTMLDPGSGRLTYANGGHNPPFWLRTASGQVQALTGRGTILGLFNDIELEQHEIQVAPGDFLVFYTDGVTDARDVNGQFFDEERLRTLLAANPQTGAQQALQAIVDAIVDFTQDAPQADDFTLFVVKRQPRRES